MRNTKSVVLLICSIILIVCAAAVTLVLMPDGNKDSKVYTDKVKKGIEYYNSGDYEDSIKFFKEAIESDPKNEEAYVNLGYAYIKIGEYGLARDIWNRGYTATGSENFKTLITTYLDGKLSASSDSGLSANSDDIGASKPDGSGITVNSSLFGKLSDYTFSDYVDAFGAAKISRSNGTATVTHPQFKGSFVYSSDQNGSSKLDSNGDPKDDAVPDSIRFDSISELFEGAGSTVSFNDLSDIGLIGLRSNSGRVYFKYHDCEVSIACDENGNITSSNAENSIVPPQKIIEGGKRHFAVDIVLATTGKHVQGDYVFEIAKAEDVRSNDSTPLGTGDNIMYTVTTRDGVVDVDLENGEYVVCIYPENDPENFKRDRWTIDDSTTDIDLKIVVTGRMAAGQIIIVLRWGEIPRDIDAHLVGEGDHIHWRRKNGAHGNLDVDCMEGNGIETITISDTGGSFTYYVDNYSHEAPMGPNSGATVEVFTEGSSAPMIFTMPENIENIWEVFRIENGVITPVNSEAAYIG